MNETISSAYYLQQYADLLEKTNQQVSLWYNPYGIMVGILTLLVAVITIVITVAAAYIIHRQSADYRESFRIAAERFFEDERKAVRAKVDADIKEERKRLASANASERKEIEIRLKNLENEKVAYQPLFSSGTGAGSATDNVWASTNPYRISYNRSGTAGMPWYAGYPDTGSEGMIASTLGSYGITRENLDLRRSLETLKDDMEKLKKKLDDKAK